MTEETTAKESQSKKPEEPTILVGSKNVMTYAVACKTLFDKGAKEVTIRARGRLISRAVDVAEITRHRFLPDLKVKQITIGTTAVQTSKGSELNVSTIDIVLAKETA